MELFGRDLVCMVQLFSGVEHRVRYGPLRHPRRIHTLFLQFDVVTTILLVRANPDIGVLVYDVLGVQRGQKAEQKKRKSVFIFVVYIATSGWFSVLEEVLRVATTCLILSLDGHLPRRGRVPNAARRFHRAS